MLKEKYQAVMEALAQAAQSSDRKPEDIHLIAVSKTHPASAIEEVYKFGHTAFGENRIAELNEKKHLLAGLNIEWHLIGQLQTNKVKLLASDVILHSLDRISLAEALAKRPEKFRTLIQVNCSEEANKSGVALADFDALVEKVAAIKNIEVLGLMTIAENSENEALVRKAFQRLKSLSDRLAAQKIFPEYRGWLSMGMSGDFALAIAEGATHVRIGSAIFGTRN